VQELIFFLLGHPALLVYYFFLLSTLRVPSTGGARWVRPSLWFALEIDAMDGQFLPAGMEVPW
jgi:hypothetical protein